MAPEFVAKSGRHYNVVRELGRGAFGVVYLVVDDSQNQFALKVMETDGDPLLVASFMQELQSTSGLTHENLLCVVDHGDATSRGREALFVVSEYCEDGDYRRRISQFAKQPSSLAAI